MNTPALYSGSHRFYFNPRGQVLSDC